MSFPSTSKLADERTEVPMERVCPECGATMVEFDRVAEEGALFIWYACSQENCTGQWLAKRALRMRSA